MEGIWLAKVEVIWSNYLVLFNYGCKKERKKKKKQNKKLDWIGLDWNGGGCKNIKEKQKNKRLINIEWEKYTKYT